MRSAPASDRRPWAGALWRLVESQSHVATLRLVDDLDEQALLEAELDRSKIAVPAACAGLHYLLSTPFRYAPYPGGSRFRRARQPEGCFYAAEHAETAVAEACFYLLLFFLDAPGARRPDDPVERTAFRVPGRTERALDLTAPPLDRDAATWLHPTDYAPCQDFADRARQEGAEAIRYRSVRDAEGRANIAVLHPGVFAAREPDRLETWHLFLRRTEVQALGETSRGALSFPFSGWRADARVPESIP